jgi:hypothetical protein
MDPSATVFYWIGLDLGQAADFSALVIAQSADRAPPRRYEVRHLARWPLNTAYTAIAQETAELAEAMALAWPQSRVALLVDATGVGRPVIDILRKQQVMPHVRMTPVVITGGLSEHFDEVSGFWCVPKRDLIGVAQVALQTGRLKIAAALPDAATLAQELQNFQMKISLAGHDSYGAWREGTHDDLLLALCLSLWRGESRRNPFVPVGHY